jgi:hypothetical protein
VGTWRSEDYTLDSVFGPGVPVCNEETFSWLEGGYFLVQTYKTVFGDEPAQTGVNYWSATSGPLLAPASCRAGRQFDLVPTRANGQPALGAYLRGPTGISHRVGLYVLTLTCDQISAMTRFENSVLRWFGLPRSLPRR